MQRKDLGYNKEMVAVMSIMAATKESESATMRYKQEVLNHNQVVNVTVSDRNFTSGSAHSKYDLPDGSRIDLRRVRVDPDYIKTLGLTLIEGRNFRPDHPSDQHNAVLINEKLATLLGRKNPVGTVLKGYTRGQIKDPTIIGVIQNFHLDSLHEPIPPLLMQMSLFNSRPEVLIRIRQDDITGTLSFLQNTWKQMAPNQAFRLSFLDENLNRQYREEQRWQRIITYASTFAIAISCLGLFGLVSLAVARRTKEIGIRKVLGATVPNLVDLLSRDFTKLLITANIIAWPAAYWIMSTWLENFTYRIELGFGIFALSGAVALIVALSTISLQTLKAARSNPVDALRNE